MGIGAFIPLIASAVGAAANWGISSAANRRAKEAQRQQMKDQQKLNQEGRDGQMKMWRETNYPEQVKQLKSAGLNAGLLYGQSGGSGATAGAPVSGQASKADVTPMQSPDIAQLGLMNAQKQLIEAQTAKAEAETAKTSGVDTTEKEISNKSNQFDLDIKNEIGAEYYARKSKIEMQAMNSENAQKIREFDAWMSQAFDSKSGDIVSDAFGSYGSGQNDLIKKVKQAGLKQTIEEVTALKAEYEKDQSQTALNKIEGEIKGFKADLSKLGLNETTATILNVILNAIFRR